MDQGLELFLLCFWGGVLGFIYSLCNALVKRKPKINYGIWTICGIVIFLSTAYFLFRIANGKVSLYGFPVMVLGFFLFLHFIYHPTAKATRHLRRSTGRGLHHIKNGFKIIFKALLLPFGFFVGISEKLLSFLGRKFSYQRKSEDTLHEEN